MWDTPAPYHALHDTAVKKRSSMGTQQPNVPININSSVEYASRSVVSKVIMKQTGGQVTLFAFDTGEGLSEHTTPFEALVTVTDGGAVISISGVEHHVSAGEAITLPANIPHAVFAKERFKMMLTMIK
jgi:quercetin dioxygenase-like cupin family protein